MHLFKGKHQGVNWCILSQLIDCHHQVTCPPSAATAPLTATTLNLTPLLHHLIHQQRYRTYNESVSTTYVLITLSNRDVSVMGTIFSTAEALSSPG